MNFLSPTADGMRCLSPYESRMRLDQLRDQLARSQPIDQMEIMREIRHHKTVLDRQSHYFINYAMPGYVPGWVPDP